MWGAIIAASQVADALRDVFPFTKKHKAASAHTVKLDSIFIDAQLEWENIFSGRFTDEQIVNRRHKLMKVRHEAERSSFPDGLAAQSSLFAQAQGEPRPISRQPMVYADFMSEVGEKFGVVVADSYKSLIMPSVTIHIPIPPGAAVPAQATQPQNIPAQAPADPSNGSK